MRAEKNRQEAWKHFWPEGNGKALKGYHLHHKDVTLRHENPERYNEWNPEDLVMITNTEHARMHRCGKKDSEETCQKKSMSLRANTKWIEKLRNMKPFLGCHHSNETKMKMSESAHHRPQISEETREKLRNRKNGMLGRNQTDETKKKISESKKGIRWWNNGTEQKQCRECPDGWTHGRIR